MPINYCVKLKKYKLLEAKQQIYPFVVFIPIKVTNKTTSIKKRKKNIFILKITNKFIEKVLKLDLL